MAARYIDIKNSLKQAILNKEYRVGDKIPSERELAVRFEVTRVTLQKAMHMLEQEGFIERIHGKGMFVTKVIEDNVYLLNNGTSDSILGFSREFKDNVKVSSRLISLKTRKAGEYIASQLDIDENDDVHYIRRVRLVDNIPVLVEDSYIPCTVIDIIPESVLQNGSLYEYIENKTGRKIKFYNSVIEASLFDDTLSALLERESGLPMLKVSGITKLEDGKTFNYSISYNRADKFKIKNSWVGK
ncbi:GntR family transcriptional regulator [Rahnella bonaserana]|jgi:GntR family transcriptional regulator|uniref:GntR family transcriptional regulator n=1 Tax=Rahnella bonaserana TaxID=2816248 RepID=A0ABS6LP89_9GAMM|nr:GntR family transcriptional regulator [Rahnella bonaserana]MBU9853846.1 GntR family transcriptional regulator [Rahnella bonaserana]MCL9644348.1 GntR family transcriptional regulator [Rahnella victoriana]WHZ40870.1 GntR family transcriptional regulator [Rahnella bonaserana]